MRQITNDDVLRELAKRNLKDFTKEFWGVIEGSRPFEERWYIDVICMHLEALYRGEIQDLIINIPPRFLKSILCCVNFPAWIWAQDPSFRSIFASYSATLSARDSIKTRQIIESEKYDRWFRQPIYDGNSQLKQRGFKLLDDQNQIRKYSTDQNGHRIATSVDGTATGEGGDLIVVDDPIGAKDVHSSVKRENANFWYDQVYQNRLDNRMTGRRLVVMQRLHQKDLTGHIMSQDLGYQHLVIPMEAPPKSVQVQTKLGWVDPRKEGEFISPARYNEEQKRKDIKSMGQFGYAGQMNQSPVPREGGLIKKADINFYDPLMIPKKWDARVLVGDLNFKKPTQGKKSKIDFAVFDVWGRVGGNFYLIDKIRGQWGYKEMKTRFKGFALDAYRDVMDRQIEDKANGPALVDDLKDLIPGLREWTPGTKDKEERVNLVAPFFESGNIWLPKRLNAMDVSELVDQYTTFPNYGIDDDVDTMTMGILILNSNSGELTWSAG